MRIPVLQTLFAYGDLLLKKLHMGIPVCIRSLYIHGTVINTCASYMLEKSTIFTVFELYIYFMDVFLEVIGDSYTLSGMIALWTDLLHCSIQCWSPCQYQGPYRILTPTAQK